MPEPVVLHVLEALEGGTARHLVDVVRHVRGFVHHVAIPAVRVGGLTDTAATPRLRDAGATVHLVDMRRSPVTWANARAVVRLRHLIKEVDVAIVHGHSSVGGALARLASATGGRPCVYTPNGVATARAALGAERILAKLTARVVAVSPSEAAVLRSHHIADGTRLVVVPNGIDLDASAGTRVDLRDRVGVAPGTPLVGTLARLVPQKAPERFVAMATSVHRRHPDVHFVLIGDGPLRARVDGQVKAAGLTSHLHRIDALPDAGQSLGQLDVFVLTSRFEGGPYSPLEAMHAAVPVVLTDVTGSRDVVDDGRSGFLVPQDATDTLADRVVRLLDDAELRERVGRAGQRRVLEAFDVVNTSAALAAVYRSVVA